MAAAKCRCAVCGSLVDSWIEDKCILCYNAAVSRPYVLELGLAYDELEQYRARKLVSLGNLFLWVHNMFWKLARRTYFYALIMWFRWTREVRSLTSSPKKECKCSGCPKQGCK